MRAGFKLSLRKDSRFSTNSFLTFIQQSTAALPIGTISAGLVSQITCARQNASRLGLDKVEPLAVLGIFTGLQAFVGRGGLEFLDDIAYAVA